MKTRLLFLLIALCMPGSFENASAQTLTNRLLAEDPARLAAEAREKGDIVRGAILYHQGNLNCAKCHRSTSDRDRFGPHLGNLSSEKPDAFIVESILNPSLEIREGFETIVASTTAGKVVYGLVVENDSQKIVLRDNANIDQLITVSKADLDELEIGRKSSMPEGLADQLKDRQQFLDLVRYVIDVKERGIVEEPQTRKEARRQLAPSLEARILLHENQCGSCHPGASLTDILSPRKPPDLKWSASWTNPHHIARFIADPQDAKPGTSMPGVLWHLDEASRRESAEAITHFLVASVKPEYRFQPIDSDAARRGHELFQAVGCVACHAPRDMDAMEQPIDERQPLGQLFEKYNLQGLTDFLENPLAVRSGGRMPNMQLDHFEAVDIANFLLQKSAAVQPWIVDDEKAEQGKALFVELGCCNCHTDPAGRDLKPSVNLPLARLRPGEGCLKEADDSIERPRQAPKFHFSNQDRETINSLLGGRRGRGALRANVVRNQLKSERVNLTLRTFNCIACHDRDHLGGVTELRNPHFQTTNLNLGDQGRLPPTLTKVGAKLKTKWMRDVLINARSVRPYMKTRMPQYGEANIGYLVDLFQQEDRPASTVEFAKFEDQKAMREFGLQLAGNQGLNCVACHTYQYKLSDTMPAVDLTEMTDRLKKQWFYDYMLQPQKFSPNTVMPSFWPGGKALRDDLEGNADFQIEALWQYLLDGRQAAMPRGVVREPMEIVVTDEAKMLRRQYPGIGKRGIGVGYPGGVNLVFDAEQMRLGMIWRGKFVDPVGVWSGQGSGNVRPLGKPFEFDKGPDVDDSANPWIVDDGRPPKHQFLGYSLDDQQQPTFRYRFNNVQVQDFFTPFADEATEQIQLRRTVTLVPEAGRDPLRFRVATSGSITAEDNGTCTLDNGLTIRINSDHSANIVEVENNQKQLQIVFDLKADQAQQLVIEYLLK